MGEDALSRMGRFWMPSWPMRAASPKREKPTMFARRDMTAEEEVVERGALVGGGETYQGFLPHNPQYPMLKIM